MEINMTDEKKRLILESEDYEEINGFIFLNGMFRINQFESPETLTNIELHILNRILEDAYIKYSNYGNEAMCGFITEIRRKFKEK
jgi:hypothetical protein